MHFDLPLKFPYSFEKTTHRLIHFEKTSYKYLDGIFYRTLRGAKGPIVVEISYSPIRHAIQVGLHGETEPHEQESLKAQIAHMFSTDVDLTPFYQQFRDLSLIGEVVQQREGLHFILDPNLYECLIKTIIGQQLNVSFAATLLNRLIQLAGEMVEFAGMQLSVFPTPEQIAGLEYEELQQLQFNRRKAEYIIDLSRKVVNGELDLEKLYSSTNDEVMQTLLPLRGVGRWTAECVLLFGLGRPNLLPAADIGLRNAIRRVYQLDEQPDEKMVRQIGEAWSPYCSYATFYLWDSLGS